MVASSVSKLLATYVCWASSRSATDTGSTTTAPCDRRSSSARSSTARTCRKPSASGSGPRVHRLADDADARSPQIGRVERRRVGVGHAVCGIGGHRIVRVVAGDRVEHERRVAHRPRHRAEGVARRVGRHHPEAADQRNRGPEPDQGVDGGRSADGPAGVLPDADQPEVGGDAGAGAARRPARVAGRVVGVADDAEGRADVARRELAHVRLGQDDGAGLLQPDDDGGVAAGDEAVEQGRPVRGRHLPRLHLVLEQHRHAVQRPGEAARGVGRVQLVGPCQRFGVDGLHGVQRRAGLVVGRDAVEIPLHQRAARQVAGRERRVHVVDRRLEQAEPALRAVEARGQQRARDQGRRPEAGSAGAVPAAVADCDDGSLHAASPLRVGGDRPLGPHEGSVPRRILAVEIACPAWRVQCSAAWKIRPRVVLGRPARPTFFRHQEVLARRGPQLVQRALDRSAGAGRDLIQRSGGLAGLALGPRRGPLRVGQRFASRVGQQPIERPAEVPDVEPDRRRAARALPDVLRRDGRRQALDVLGGPGAARARPASGAARSPPPVHGARLPVACSCRQIIVVPLDP